MDRRVRGASGHPYVAVNNLLDREYNDNLRVNAGFGRYYEPAADRVVLGGLSVTF